MARRVVSLLRHAPAALRPTDAALEANAYAVAEDVDLTLVLRGRAVEMAVAGGEVAPQRVGGVTLPPAAADQDLHGLLESGVTVLVAADDLGRLGLSHGELVEGVSPVGDDELARVLREADAVLTW